jgi:hypothetical protein
LFRNIAQHKWAHSHCHSHPFVELFKLVKLGCSHSYWKPFIGRYFLLLSNFKVDRVNGCHCKVDKQCSNAKFGLYMTISMQTKCHSQLSTILELWVYHCNLMVRTSHCLPPPKCACRPACSNSTHIIKTCYATCLKIML